MEVGGDDCWFKWAEGEGVKSEHETKSTVGIESTRIDDVVRMAAAR